MKMQIAIILKKVANNEVIDAFGIRFFASIMIANEYNGNARFATANCGCGVTLFHPHPCGADQRSALRSLMFPEREPASGHKMNF